MSLRALRSLLSACAILAVTGAANAATLQESAVAGSDFSSNWATSTIIANGSESLSGVWSGGNDYDFLAFTGLQTGAQTLSLTFAPLGPQGYSFSAGGSILYKTSPYQYSAWEGTWLGGINFGHWNQGTPQTLTLSLDSTFGGTLYLGLYGTHGTLGYTISAPGNAAPPGAVDPGLGVTPVPVPSSLLLLGSVLVGGLAFARRRTAA